MISVPNGNLRSSIFYSCLSCLSLRFLRRRRRSLLDDFDYFARISLFVVLEHEVLGLERIALAVELDRAGDTFEVFDVPDGGGDLSAARPLAAVGFDPLFHRLDGYHRGVVAVHGERLDVPAEALLKFFGEGRGFRIGVRRAGDGGIVAAGDRPPSLILSPIAACSPESGACTAILIVLFCAHAGTQKFRAAADTSNPISLAINDILVPSSRIDF